MKTTTAQALVQALTAEQGALSDRAFARQLGVSASLWNRTRRGKLPVGMTIIRAAMRCFPALQIEALLSLRRESTISNTPKAQTGRSTKS